MLARCSRARCSSRGWRRGAIRRSPSGARRQMRDFQLAFFKSGVPHIDIPQDHAFIATLYNFAAKHKIKYILNGGNYSTECVRNPLEFFYYGTDMAQIRDIRRQYCTNPMRSYPFSSILRHKVYLRYIRRIQVIKPLNYFPYIKAEAMQFLKDTYGWIPYPQKHFESRFTFFIKYEISDFLREKK